jgi:hypothetical protein
MDITVTSFSDFLTATEALKITNESIPHVTVSSELDPELARVFIEIEYAARKAETSLEIEYLSKNTIALLVKFGYNVCSDDCSDDSKLCNVNISWSKQ